MPGAAGPVDALRQSAAPVRVDASRQKPGDAGEARAAGPAIVAPRLRACHTFAVDRALPAAARALDLRGERCPYTFIKTKLALEEMSDGEALEVWLDFPPSYVRVPASLAVLGYGVLAAWDEAGGRKLLIRKAE